MPIIGTTNSILRESQQDLDNTVKAMSTNTGLVYLGISTVSSTTGFELSAGEQIFIPVSNLNGVYLDVAVTAEGITYIGN